jgi:hypothetical protein
VLRPPDPLDLLPDPQDVHRRLSETVRAERLLRRLLRLALAARGEREQRAAEVRPPNAVTIER